MDRENCRLFNRVRELSFALYETALYLDTHPDDRGARTAFREYQNALKTARAQYEETVGPLTLMGATANGAWDWVERPWPWED